MEFVFCLLFGWFVKGMRRAFWVNVIETIPQGLATLGVLIGLLRDLHWWVLQKQQCLAIAILFLCPCKKSLKVWRRLGY